MGKGKRKKYKRQLQRKTNMYLALWGALGVAVVLFLTIPDWKVESRVRFGPNKVARGDEVFVRIRLNEPCRWMRIEKVEAASSDERFGRVEIYKVSADALGPPKDLPAADRKQVIDTKTKFTVPSDVPPGEYEVTVRVDYVVLRAGSSELQEKSVEATQKMTILGAAKPEDASAEAEGKQRG